MRKLVLPVVVCSAIGTLWSVALRRVESPPPRSPVVAAPSVCRCGPGCCCAGDACASGCNDGDCGGLDNMIGREKGQDGRPCPCKPKGR